MELFTILKKSAQWGFLSVILCASSAFAMLPPGCRAALLFASMADDRVTGGTSTHSDANNPIALLEKIGSPNSFEHPYLAYRPDRSDLYFDNLPRGTDLRGRAELANALRADLAQVDHLYQNISDQGHEYHRNPRFQHNSYYNTVETIEDEFLRSQAKDLQLPANPDAAQIALAYLQDRVFRHRSEYNRTDPMSRSIGSYYLLAQEESHAIGWILPVFFRPSIPAERRMELVRVLSQNGHSELSRRIMAWQIQRTQNLDTAFGYLEQYLSWEPGNRDFVLEFGLPYLANHRGLQIPHLFTQHTTSRIASMLRTDFIYPHVLAELRQGRVNRLHLGEVVRHYFINISVHSNIEKDLRQMFLANPALLGNPELLAVAEQYHNFNQWLMYITDPGIH